MRIVKIKTSKDIIDSMSLEQLKEYARTIKTDNSIVTGKQIGRAHV